VPAKVTTQAFAGTCDACVPIFAPAWIQFLSQFPTEKRRVTKFSFGSSYSNDLRDSVAGLLAYVEFGTFSLSPLLGKPNATGAAAKKSVFSFLLALEPLSPPFSCFMLINIMSNR
jgi:hypothetical protein